MQNVMKNMQVPILIIYQQLGLGELSPTQVTIQLVDRSSEVQKGEINDVLIRVGKFIYPVDFIILETQLVVGPKAHHSSFNDD